MNPRIMKKLSKRVAVHAKALGYSIDIDGPTGCQYTRKGYSRKRSHREFYRNRHGIKVMGDMLTPKLTPWFCWTDYGPDGGEGDGAIAWEHIETQMQQRIDNDARDWSHPSMDAEDYDGDYPPYLAGKPPKLPRNPSQMLRVIEHLALVETERKAISKLRWQQDHQIIANGTMTFSWSAEP